MPFLGNPWLNGETGIIPGKPSLVEEKAFLFGAISYFLNLGIEKIRIFK